MLSGVRQSIASGDVSGAVAQAQAYNARIAEARKAGLSLPFTPMNVQVVERDARGRYQRIVREPQGARIGGARPQKVAKTEEERQRARRIALAETELRAAQRKEADAEAAMSGLSHMGSADQIKAKPKQEAALQVARVRAAMALQAYEKAQGTRRPIYGSFSVAPARPTPPSTNLDEFYRR